MRQAPLFVASEESCGAGIFTFGNPGGQHLTQHRSIEEPQVHALSGQRMHHVRRVADQRDARADHGQRSRAPQRHGQALAEQPRGSQHAIAGGIKPPRELIRRQRRQFFGQRLVRGPDNRTAAIEEWQQREGSGAEKPLPGGVLMRPRALDVRHDGTLAVIVAAQRDFQEFTHLRMRTVRSDHQPGRQLGLHRYAGAPRPPPPAVPRCAHPGPARPVRQNSPGPRPTGRDSRRCIPGSVRRLRPRENTNTSGPSLGTDSCQTRMRWYAHTRSCGQTRPGSGVVQHHFAGARYGGNAQSGAGISSEAWPVAARWAAAASASEASSGAISAMRAAAMPLWRASSAAAIAPLGPPPMMATSKSVSMACPCASGHRQTRASVAAYRRQSPSSAARARAWLPGTRQTAAGQDCAPPPAPAGRWRRV